MIASVPLGVLGCSGAASPANPSDDIGDAAVPTDVHRFLNRATFGASPAEISRVRSMGYEAWIDDQLTRPATLVLPELLSTFPCAPEISGDLNCDDDEYDSGLVIEERGRLWWENALRGDDQLRQRVAFALSQILVVSEVHDHLDGFPFSIADYQDRLAIGAFGSFRELIEEVSRNSAMGLYLGMVRNRKADPIAGTRPDENFARELMQLFTIGLSVLNPDGTLALDANGAPLPTYDQTTITETARALTGWTYSSDDAPSSDLFDFLEVEERAGPMTPWPAFHDDGAKTIVGGTFLSAGMGAEADLEAVLDALANHPNVGPFIGKQLIQRMVTSNPSPAYVERVSSVWDDDGSGVRGNLGAVVKAILLDPEARAGTREAPHFGIVKEPVLRVAGVLRAFGGEPFSALEMLDLEEEMGQRAFAAPSVFNFFRPTFTTNALGAQGLVSPEMQITTHSGIAGQNNVLTDVIFEGAEADPPLWNIDPLLAVADDPDALVARVEKRLLGERLPESARGPLVAFLDGVPLDEPDVPLGYERALEALNLIAHSPSYTVQK